MGRRKWASVAAPAGWYEVIRGPRPPTVSWSSQPKGWRNGTEKVPEVPQVSGPRGRWRQGAPQHVRQPETVRSRHNPNEVWVGASNKITKLQAALAVLGEDDETERSAWEVALKKAQAQAVVQPVSEQMSTPRSSSSARRNVWCLQRSTFSGHKTGRSSATTPCWRQKNVLRDCAWRPRGPRPLFPTQ